MTKIIHCRDIGFDCEGVISAETEEEALAMAAFHARDVHGVNEMTPELVEQVKAVIRES